MNQGECDAISGWLKDARYKVAWVRRVVGMTVYGKRILDTALGKIDAAIEALERGRI